MSTRRVANSPEAGKSNASLGWDPYQVWLTRVQQPRERVARRQGEEQRATSAANSDATSETARLRALGPAFSR